MAESIEFSLSLYSKQAVLESVAAYDSFLDCNVEVSDSSIHVSMTPKVEGVDDLSDHFANHVLHLSIVENRGALA